MEGKKKDTDLQSPKLINGKKKRKAKNKIPKVHNFLVQKKFIKIYLILTAKKTNFQ